jgi:transcriptional regulator with XRE-family HTH domain
MNTFADNLRKARIRQGHTQSSFAILTGFPQSHISDFERGRRTPTLRNLNRLQAALFCTWDTLLGKPKVK